VWILTLRTVVAKGDRRASLEAIRDGLALQLQKSSGAAAAALARELRMLLAEIAALPDEKGATPLDDIAARVANLDDHRRRRRPAASGS